MKTKKSLKRRITDSTLKLIRRVHLFSGIVMFPFVLLYGLTGWWFNHPRHLTGDEVRTFAAAGLETSEAQGLATLPTAEEAADAIVEELNIQAFLVGGPQIERTAAKRPTYTRYMVLTAEAEDGTSHTVTVDPRSGDGEIRTRLPEKEEEAETEEDDEPADPLAGVSSIELTDGADPLKKAQEALPAALEELGLEADAESVSAGRRTPQLVFSATADGEPITVFYTLGRGSVAAVPDGPSGPIGGEKLEDQKRFLQRLHLTRGYTPQADVRWVWAVIVDIMAVSMVFWGISGLFMWWQVKRTRTSGAALLVLGVVAAAGLAALLHIEFDLASKSFRR